MSQLGLPMQDEEHRPSRHHRRARKRRHRSWLAVVVSICLLIALVGGGWLLVGGIGAKIRLALSGPEDYPGPGSGQVQVQVPEGATAGEIGKVLAKADVVKSSGAFVEAARANPKSTGIQPGFYALKKQMRAKDAVTALLDPASRLLTKVTIPEGLRLDETVKLIAAKTKFKVADLEKALADPKALGLPSYARGRAEGYLFPATYDVQPSDTAASLLKAMVDQWKKVAAEVGVESGAVPADELVTIASLVEAEARNPEDYGKVARVVYNRLAKDMPLQFDSTVNYALKADKTIVTFKDLKVKSAWNTYAHAGLPPAPIGSPGKAALEAALHPPAGDWLYFVTVNPSTGETKFTGDYQEFLKFKAELKAAS